MRFDTDKFYSGYRARFGKLTASQVDGLGELLSFIEADRKMQDVRHAAYLLATAGHETAHTFKPITERGGKGYFDKYNAGTRIGRRLGNTQPGDGYNFRGRGYVQITGRDNYEKFSTKDDDLLANPELALQPETAYAIAVAGMRTGAFTGKKLTDYISGKRCDYVNARRIINGTDKALSIADAARRYESILVSSVVDDDVVEAPVKAVPAAQSPTVPPQALDASPTTDAPPANEGEAAPETPAENGQAVVGGRPSDPIIKLPSSLSEAKELAEKARSYLPDGSDTTKRWATRSAAGAFLIAAWRWLTDPTHLIPILILIGIAALFIGGWLLSRYLTKKHARALEAAERARYQTQEFELQKLKLQIESQNAARLADPSQYNVVVDTGAGGPVAEKGQAS